MRTVVVLCGGESGEHEVSLLSASSILSYIPRERYSVIPVGISKMGEWLTGDPLFEHENDPSRIRLATGLTPVKLERGKIDGKKIDAVFPIIHGSFGEDGSLQGVLEMFHLPFVGSGVLGSAMGMDKDITKRLCLFSGIHCARHKTVYRWQTHRPTYREITADLGAVVFIKPCNLGSSIGISKCRDEKEYEAALSRAFDLDNKILIEECIEGKEIEVSVLGNERVEVSVPGEIIPGEEFYSYDAKYINSQSTQLKIPAGLNSAIEDDVRKIAGKVYRVLELSGLARIDFFVEKKGKVWLNEVNTLPGFTKISMYPKLWEASGVSYPELIHRLIELSITRFESEAKLKRNRG